MAFPSLTYRRVFVVIVAALVVGSLIKSRYAVYSMPMRNAVSTLLMPITRPMNMLATSVRGSESKPVLGKLQQLSDELRYKDALLLSLQNQVRQLQATNAELQGLAARLGDEYVFREAHVLGRSSDPAAGTLTIDMGARHGLRPGMAVVKGASLVGRLIEVGPNTSVMSLITMPDSLIEVVLAPAHLPVGGLSSARQSLVQLHVAGPDMLVSREVDRDVPAAVGDYARLDDARGPESWPSAVQGMIVGQVVSVKPNPDKALLTQVAVEPLLSLGRLDTVTIVVPREGPEVGR